jgi:hypothetical protein
MKTVLILISGIFFGILVFGGGAVYFLRGAQVSELEKNTIIINPADQVKIPVTFMVPPQLDGVVKSGKNSIAFGMTNFPPGTDLRAELPVMMNPVFPLRVVFVFDRHNLLARQKGKSAEVFLWANYFDSSLPGAAPFVGPTVAAPRLLKIELPDVKNNAEPVTLKETTVYFTRNFAQSILYKCPKPPTTFSGKITPSSAFIKNHLKNKIALVVYRYENKLSSFDYTAVSDSEFDELVLHYQFLDFSKGTAQFSFIDKNITAPFYRLLAVECRASDSVRACAMGAFPSKPLGSPENRLKFVAHGKNLEMPYCGNSQFEAFVDGPLDQQQPFPLEVLNANSGPQKAQGH